MTREFKSTFFLWFMGILVTILIGVFGTMFTSISAKVSMDDFKRFEQRQYEYNEKLSKQIQNLSLLINTNATLITSRKRKANGNTSQ